MEIVARVARQRYDLVFASDESVKANGAMSVMSVDFRTKLARDVLELLYFLLKPVCYVASILKVRIQKARQFH